MENWNAPTSPYFSFLQQGGGTITSGYADSQANDGRIALLTLPAQANPSPSGGPNLKSNELYGYGTYEARFKTADCSAQPNSGIINGFFTFLNDGTDQNGNGIADNSEIDLEWLCAEPNVVWMTMWTDYQDSPLAMRRVYRELDIATGTIRRTCYSEGFGQCTQDLSASSTEGAPSAIAPMPGYNSASAYHTYGFTWEADHVTWYMLDPTTNAKHVLWDYHGPSSRITHRSAYYMINLWHTPAWSPTGMPAAVEAPNSPRSLSIDWTRFATSSDPVDAGAGTTPTRPDPASSCGPQWSPAGTYHTGDKVTENGQTYQANFWTNGDDPKVHSGPAGSGQPWLTLGPCENSAGTGQDAGAPTDSGAPVDAGTNDSGPIASPRAMLFDDFSYTSPDDPGFLANWKASDYSPAAPGLGSFSKSNVVFLPDPANGANTLMRVMFTTAGSRETTIEGEVEGQRRFLYGTYATRMKYYDQPITGPSQVSGPDTGDHMVSTFFTISPWYVPNSEYGELDFEYLANAGWNGDGPRFTGPTMWNTTWKTRDLRVTKPTAQDCAGWHTFWMTVSPTAVSYYMDDTLLVTHTDQAYIPKTEMLVMYNLWLTGEQFAQGQTGTSRTWAQDVDWIYYAKDTYLARQDVENAAAHYQAASTHKVDTLPPPIPAP